MMYYEQVEGDARDFIEEYLEDFKKDSEDYGGKSSDPSFYQWMDYDGKLHEHTDAVFNSYDEEVICDESNELETDYGLWEGVTDWRKMREAQAFWTLKGDLWFTIEGILKEEELLPLDQID